MRWARAAVAIVVLSAVFPPAAQGAGSSGGPRGGSDVAVTLVTGDRVVVSAAGAGRQAVAIRPARWPGRRVRFQTWYAEGRLRVLPSDVAHLVPGVLDPELFDVSGLVRMGYNDAASPALPLIVRRGGPGTVAVGPMRRTLALPSIDAAAVKLDKADAVRLGPTLAAARAPRKAQGVTAGGTAIESGPLSGVTHVWLDEKVRASAVREFGAPALDRNLRQVGAPAAWAAGLSGAGVRLAVLDTGIDTTHPDLRGKVEAEENFTDSPTVADRVGHGTHVASLAGGSGRAAAGRRRGIAFGAGLLSGKVLGDDGRGQASWIIAGMEWAAARRARVVNMSLATETPSTGQDPLSLAVDAISASSGALFVVAAGNTGPAPATVAAPGAAGSALTVGAVDSADRIAEFSGRGPRLGNYAIKPDITAPGVDIIGARAAGTRTGRPAGRRYVRLSGTSMATPHAAGAAALLAELRPDWSAATLKAALMGTSTATPGGVFAGGAGRLDLGRAIAQRTIASTPQIGYGQVPYPQAELPPIGRPLSLVNTGRTPVTVDLAAALDSPDGGPAPDGMLTVSPARLRLPAGGSAAATVTLAPALGGFGAFSGAVTVTSAGASWRTALRVPVGVVKESTRHMLRLHGLDRNGAAKVDAVVTVVNLEDATAAPRDPVFMTGGRADLRLPPGHYAITTAIFTPGDDEPPPDLRAASSFAIVTRAEQTLDRDTDVVLDARDARPISATVRGVRTEPVDLHLFVAAQDGKGNTVVASYDAGPQDVTEGRLFVQPTEPVRHGRLEASSKWRLDVPDGGSSYDLLFAGPAFPPSLEYVADPEALAPVSTTYRAPVEPVGYDDARFAWTDVNPVSVAVARPVPGVAPLRRTDYVTAEASQRWFQCVWVVSAEQRIGDFCEAPATYRPGVNTEHAWLRAPLRTSVGAYRDPTRLLFGLNELGEDAPHSGSIAGHVFDRRTFRLYRDGRLLAEGEDPIGVHTVPRGRAVYRLDRGLHVRPGLFPLSTSVESSWTFTSRPPRRGKGFATEPIVDVRVGADVDERDRVPGDRALVLDLEARHSSGSTSRFTTAWLSVSADDGVTWRPVRLDRRSEGRYRGEVATGVLPAGALVSLRSGARDADGNRSDQTIVRAFAIAPASR